MRSAIVLSSGSLAALSCFIALIACGASSNDAPNAAVTDASAPDASADADAKDADVASPVTIAPVEEVCSNSAKTICEFLETCSPETAANLWASMTECEPRLRENCLAGYPANAAARQDDADEYASCLAELTCDDLYGSRWSTGCKVPRLASAKPLASPCRSDFECESHTCTGSSTACGTCVAPKSAGEPCSSSRECQRGGYCNTNCYEPAFLDEPCDTFQLCGIGLVCTGGTCKKVSGKVGDACSTDEDCDSVALISCNETSGKCESTTFVDPNSACPKVFADGPPIACGKGSSCITPNTEDPGTCVPNAKVGEACGDAVNCEAFVNCRNGKCVTPTWSDCP